MTRPPVIDADGHVMEPGGLWRDYADASHRDDAIFVRRDASSGDRLVVGGRLSAQVGRLGGVPPQPDDTTPNWHALGGLPEYLAYDASVPRAAQDPSARLDWLDRQGIDATILFPSLGLIWPREEGLSPAYVRANMAAYNRWIREFSQAAPHRLIPVAQTCLFGIEEAVGDMKALAASGFRHVMLPVQPVGSVSCFHPRYDPWWQAAEAHGMAVHLHKAAIPHCLGLPARRLPAGPGMGRLYSHMIETLPGLLCLAAILDHRVTARFPGVRLAILECGAGWLPWLLDRADESWETIAGETGPGSMPRALVEESDNIFVTLAPNEDASALARWAGRLMVASDYPHPGFLAAPMAAWSGQTDGLAEDAAGAVLGGNASRLLAS